MKRIFLILAFFAPAACQKDSIETRRVPKENQPSAAVPASGVRWTTPSGWTQLPGSAMRVATFQLPKGPGKAEVTVVALPGDVGGELANVNRWRGQIALPPLAEGDLSKGRATVKSALGPIFVYDYSGTGAKKTRLCAGMISVDGTMWFFKLMGDDAAVSAAKPAFLKLLEGLKS